jgi:hypothetical protein
MDDRRRFRMRFEEVVQHMEQRPCMPHIATPLRLANIVPDHISNAYAPAILGQKILGQCRSNFRKVFVLGNREHLLLGQPAESDAVFQRNHIVTIAVNIPRLRHYLTRGRRLLKFG